MMSTKLPTGIKVKGNRLLMRIKRPGRGWEWEATGLEAAQLAAAAKLRATTQALIDSGHDAESHGRVRVEAYAKRWLEDRRARGLKTVDDDETRLERHVLGYPLATGRRFGALWVDEVRPSHCRAVVRACVEKKLAPRTVHNVNAVASQLFADAVADEMIAATPWHVPRKELPRKRDADPAWRALAKFTLPEIRALLWAPDDKVPWDRRVFYALAYFGALRFGEASALRWRDRLDGEPLRALHVHAQYSTDRGVEDETKTEAVRKMPEHPTLSALLAEWKLRGWAQYFGRAPTDGDLIVPSRLGRNRSSNHMLRKFHEDLDRLGQRPRRQHDLRRSFIGHAVDAGASRERLRPGTHGLGTSVLELYDSPEWAACCEAVLALELQLGEMVELPIAVGAEAMGTPWGRNRKTGATGGLEGKYWRGGRDSKTRDRARLVGSLSSNSSEIGQRDASASRPIATDQGASVPIVPTGKRRYFPPAIVLDCDVFELAAATGGAW